MTTNDETPEARPVRVPNVSPGAKSGLAHDVIGSDAIDAYELTHDPAADPDPERSVGVVVPAGSLEDRVTWVADAEDTETAITRANAVWDHEVTTGADAEAQAHLSGALQDAVHGTTPPLAGEAEHVGGPDSGPLPPIEDDGTGTPLPEPEPLPSIPEDATSVDAILDWIKAGEDETDRANRALAAYVAEGDRDPDDQRTTLLNGIRPFLPQPTPDEGNAAAE